MCHHVEKPAVEQFGPVRVVAGYCLGECQDTVFPVPVRKVVQIIFQRIEYRDAVGVDRGKFSLSDEADKLKRYKSSRICDIRYISFACDMPLARYVPSARERTACA